jgi:Tol biopolymer transport system component
VNRNRNQGENYVRGQAKPPSPGSAARKTRRSALILACLALIASLAFAVSPALAVAPVVTMGAVTNPTYTTVEASGEVDPEGEPVGYGFQVSTDGTNWEGTNLSSFSSATDPEPLSGIIQNLQPETHYFLRLTAINEADGTSVSSAEPYSEFTTLGPIAKPTVTIDPVTIFTDSTASFSGKIDPGAAQADPGFNVRWHFECEPACSDLTNGSSEFADDGNEHTVETDAGIEPNIDYTIKLVAENGGGSETDQTTFHSSAGAPAAETLPAFSFGDGTEALIGGKVNPRNSSTSYWLEYGPGPGGPGATYPSSIPLGHDGDAGAGDQFTFESRRISGLTQASTYHFRIVAENAAGATYGRDISFETLAAAVPPPASCANDVLRSETGSGQLPECRAYEMVTYPDKNGGDANHVAAVTADGNRLGYYSATGFGDTESSSGQVAYLAQRTAAGWTTKAMQVPNAVPNLGFNAVTYPADFTNDLSAAVNLGDALSADQLNVRNIFLKRAEGSTTWVTAPTVAGEPAQRKGYSGRSADGSHIVFESSEGFTDEANGSSQVWEWLNGQIRLVSILPGGEVPLDGASVGSGKNGDATEGTNFDGNLREPTAVSEDGSRIFFGGGSSLAFGVYVRENGSETRQLDLSQRTGSIGAPGEGRFVGAAADGSVVLFFSFNRLTDDATNEGGLYAFDLETDTLRFLTAGATDPAGAQLEGVPAFSKDGSRVFFVARSILVPGRGAAGGHNLYFSDPTGVHHITTLGDYDGQDWSEAAGSAGRYSSVATPDGRFLFFQSWERLTSFDNAGHQEIYRFDTSDEALICVSCGNGPGPASGDASMFPNPLSKGGFASFTYQGGRTEMTSADGTRVLFESTAQLVPSDTNAREDVYLYRGGHLTLVSGGTGESDSEVAGITPDGENVLFSTRDSLVGQDIDGGGGDIYDARVDGGFPAPTGVDLCESESACQGAAAPPPGFTAPATTTPGRGNPPRHKKAAKKCNGKAKKKKKHARCGKKKHGKKTAKSGRNQ